MNTLTEKELTKKLDNLAKKLGFGSVTSYAKMYGTTLNTFGKKSASMWFFTISKTIEDKICGIEVNTTYFSHTKQTTAINNNCSFKNPITFEEALLIVDNLQ